MIDEIIRLIILEASSRKGQNLVNKIATVEMEIMQRMIKILCCLREEERKT